MIQITPQMRILVAIEPCDFRKGIDGLARVCKEVLKQDPFSGWVFVFRNRPATALKALIYDGQGFWLCHKRLSSGKFRWWPAGTDAADGADQCRPSVNGARSVPAGARTLAAHQLHVLFSAGNPEAVEAAPVWRAVGYPAELGAAD
jgi:transposase